MHNISFTNTACSIISGMALGLGIRYIESTKSSPQKRAAFLGHAAFLFWACCVTDPQVGAASTVLTHVWTDPKKDSLSKKINTVFWLSLLAIHHSYYKGPTYFSNSSRRPYLRPHLRRWNLFY